jgi:anti-sigma regulatory factor (Ser/Thr protein kinase)
MQQVAVRLDDTSQVAEARRVAVGLSRGHGLGEELTARLALAVTELATNVLKHATRGQMLMRLLEDATSIELLCIDKGPGIANVGESLRDGQSTAGSLGLGLGTLERASTELDIYSHRGNGTIVRCIIGAKPVPAGAFTLGALCLPRQGEIACGDAWLLLPGTTRHLVLVVDGLGHGPDAARAAQAAVTALQAAPDGPLEQLMAMLHESLRPTRGAAASLAAWTPDRQTLQYCGVGNIVAMIRADGRTRHLVSHNGTLGHQVRKMQAFDMPFPRGALLFMHSDGINTHWKLEDYPGLEARHPALMAAMLYRDHDRVRDDRTVVVVRNGAA